MDDGFVPVIAPITVECQGEAPTGQLLNINADTAAGAVAAALRARWLVFLTDVPGILGEGGRTVGQVSEAQVAALTESGVIQGGMIPKVEACLQAAASGCRSVIADGRGAGALLEAIEGGTGTMVG
jgi:acetylglutamate kinase